MNHKIYPDKTHAARQLAHDICELISSLKKDKITLAISGGTTPYILFDIWANDYKTQIDWKKIHFFWVDERCVSPTNAESNFGNTKKVLFENIDIPKENIHRIRGENDPIFEAYNYTLEITKHVAMVNGIPKFDIILLGIGDDGHTASIFPSQIQLIHSENFVLEAQNPYNKQHRITLTGKVINNASHIYFLVTGKSKAEVLKQIFNKEEGYLNYPASHIIAIDGELKWYLDEDAVGREL